MMQAQQDKCPKCGKYQPHEAEGYYAREMYADGTESGHVRVFCNADCYFDYRQFRIDALNTNQKEEQQND